MSAVLALVAGAVVSGFVGMVWRELHVGFSYAARGIARRSARILAPPMRAIREEE
jgi:hypothetical protein